MNYFRVDYINKNFVKIYNFTSACMLIFFKFSTYWIISFGDMPILPGVRNLFSHKNFSKSDDKF